MKKKLSLFMAIVLLLSSVLSLSGCTKKDSESDKSVTQGEWLATLNEKFGMYTYQSSVPYYDDVDSTNKYFGAVQIAYEWDIIDDDTELALDEPVTKQFAANTLVRAVGYKDIDEMSEDEVTELAAEQGYIDFSYRGRTDNERTITAEEAEKSIAASKQIWTNPDFGNPVDNSKYQDSVVDLSEQKLEGYYAEENKVYIPTANLTEEEKKEIETIQKDVVYILPAEDEFSTFSANKAESVETNEEYIIITNSNEELEGEQVYERLVASGSVTPNLTAYPITDGAGNVLIGSATLQQMRTYQEESQAVTLNVNTSSKIETLDTIYMDTDERTLNFETDGLSIKGSIVSDHIEFSVKGSMKMENGGTIEVGKSYNISEIAFDYDTDCNFLNIQKSSLYAKLSYKTVDTSAMKYSYDKTMVAAPKYTNGNGKFPSNFQRSILKDANAKGAKSIKIATIPILINGGVRIDLDIKIKISLSGEVTLEVTTKNGKGFEYKNGNLRYIDEEEKSSQLTVKGEAELTLYTGFSIIILKNLRVAGAGIEFGIGGKVATNIYLTDEKHHLIDEVKFDSGNSDMILEQVGAVNGVNYQHEEYGSITIKCETCVDTTVYGIVKLSIDSASFVGKILGALKIPTEKELVNEKNGKIEAFCGHYENWVKVPECTRKYNDEKETETETEVDTIGTSDGRLDMSVYYMSLLVGESGRIEITDVPVGYQMKDLVWETSDSQIVTVDSNGNVRAVSAGIVTITVRTSDGKYKCSCTVSIGGADYT